MTTPYRKKMIEVAIPLDAINKEAAREKSIRHGHPSTLHLWWARRPLAACRAVLFTSLIDDPGEEGVPKELLAKIDELPPPPDPAEGDTITETRRKKLFAFIGDLVKWESTTDEKIIGKARELIMAATGGNPPPVLDPFCGGGSIPLEAQRLGLQAYASDLNPVAVLITKALIEIPPKFAGKPPVNPNDRERSGAIAPWKGATGLATDVRYYGKWMRDRAFERIGHLYPKGPNGETVIAWLWARTVRCPNPACGVSMPLVRSFWLSKKPGNEAWLKPVSEPDLVSFVIVRGKGSPPDGTMSNRSGKCLTCGSAADLKYIRNEACAGRMDRQGIAIVTVGSGGSGRNFHPFDAIHEAVARTAKPLWSPTEVVTTPSHDVDRLPMYGMPTWGDAFSPRQLAALTAFADLIPDVTEAVLADARIDLEGRQSVSLTDDGTAYAQAIATYLALGLSKAADLASTICHWQANAEHLKIAPTFSRQALAMSWDYAEGNPFSDSSGNFTRQSELIADVLANLGEIASPLRVAQIDATSAPLPTNALVSTDPPYYDNIGYADLSDFFYVWLRRSLRSLYPDLLSTMLTPKERELVAMPHRFDGDKSAAFAHFEEGLRKTFAALRVATATEFPMTVYYAYKQTESTKRQSQPDTTASKGWEAMLSGLIDAGLEICGTWPVRTERQTRSISIGTNALASSVVLACRPRQVSAPLATLREFQTTLRAELPSAVRQLTGGHIAPVDLAQAAIGPGMAVFSRYEKVLEPNGSAMTVRRALELINGALDEYFNELEGAFDAETQFCSTWFEQHGFQESIYGEADVLAKAKGIAVDALARDGVLKSGGGKVMLWGLMHYQDQLAGYDPALDTRLSAWEACHYLAAALRSGGEGEAAKLARRLGGVAETARDLAYRLYSICEHKKWSEEARPYNELVASWPEIQKRAAALSGETQGTMG